MTTKPEMRELLLEIYNADGPRKDDGVVPPAEFAAMDDHSVNRWDFERRWLMHRIARAITD